MFGDSSRDLLIVSGISSCKKHLDKFFKFCHTGFWWLAPQLVCDSFQSQKSHVLRIEGYFQGSFQIFFSFPSYIVIVHYLPLPNSPCSFSKTSFFFIISSPIFKKRYGLSIFLKVFHVSNLWFLGFCVFVEFWKIWYSNTVWVYFVEFNEWVLLVLIVCCLLYIFSCLLLILE